MPAIQRGSAYRLGPNRWGLRWRDREGIRRRKSPFPSKSAALGHYRDVIEPELRGEPAPTRELTLAEFVALYLERHAATVCARTIDAVRWRLGIATAAFGDVPLRDLERMSGEIASWRAKLPERSRFASPRRSGRGSAPPCAGPTWAGTRRSWSGAPGTVAAAGLHLHRRRARGARHRARARLPHLAGVCPRLPASAPRSGRALERRDVDRAGRVLNVKRTVSGGEIVELGKTVSGLCPRTAPSVSGSRSRRELGAPLRRFHPQGRRVLRLQAAYGYPLSFGAAVGLAGGEYEGAGVQLRRPPDRQAACSRVCARDMRHGRGQ
jgi:hypothetical protein